MPEETPNDPRMNFVPRFLPWVLGAAMFALYWTTLNYWINFLNLVEVAQLTGLNWQPQIFSPLTYLATLPIRLLPPASVPFALNVFAAACAAISLVLLARCVSLLPHDRVEMERQREKSDFAFLTGWIAWLPPIFAVALCGLQLTMWQHATSFAGETFDLLLFAVVVWQFLEYRLDEWDVRLYFAAFVFGASITENWGMLPFTPLFIAPVIWMKGLQFFRATFLLRLAGFGFAGLLFLLLLPLLSKFTTHYPVTFWELLRPALSNDWQVIKALARGDMIHNLLLVGVTTLLPLLVLGLRWSPSFGDSSRISLLLTNLMIHLVYGIIFGLCIWVFFNPAASPDHVMTTPCLPLYFLAALGASYLFGYFLLVFSRKAEPGRRADPQPALPGPLELFCPVVVVITLATAVLVLSTLVYRNHPIVRSQNDDTLYKFADLATRNLPREGAILLCDSDNAKQNLPLRSFLLQSMLIQQGRAKDYPVLDTQSLMWFPYLKYLHQNFPAKFSPVSVADEKSATGLNPLAIFNLIVQLSKSNTVCYLNPSYGYYFEQFYLEPHGMVYVLKNLPEDTLLPRPNSAELVAENEKFWVTAATEFPRIQKNVQVAQTNEKGFVPYAPGLFGWILMHMHTKPEPNPNLTIVGNYYSRSLDFWGVQQQRAGALDAAKQHFENARITNPDNVAADINLKFNAVLRAGSTSEVELTRVTADQFGKYRNWNEILNANGPFDESSFCFENGVFLMDQGGLMRQAVEPFTRVRQLMPDNLATRLYLAQIYIFAKQPDRALEALHDPLTRPAKFLLNENNSTEINILAASIYFQKNDNAKAVELMETEVERHPDDETLLTAATQAFFMRGLYTNALQIIDRKLARSPDDSQWLFGKGFAKIQLKQYDDAIAAMTRVMEVATNDPTARFNRALAYLQSDRLPEARKDYSELQGTYTNSFQVAYGLAEIAWRMHDTNEALRNYQLYLGNAPTNTAEAATVRDRLAQLRGK